MPKYRKKPVEIEAVQFTEQEAEHWHNAPKWLLQAAEDQTVYAEGGKLYVQTLEGTMTADLGDWIIRGIKGEIYPCKPDIFAATYDPVS